MKFCQTWYPLLLIQLDGEFLLDRRFARLRTRASWGKDLTTRFDIHYCTDKKMTPKDAACMQEQLRSSCSTDYFVLTIFGQSYDTSYNCRRRALSWFSKEDSRVMETDVKGLSSH